MLTAHGNERMAMVRDVQDDSASCNLIPWVIERLLQGEYMLETDPEGVAINLELGRERGSITVQSMEEDLRVILSPEHSYLLFTLKDPHSDEDTKVALTGIFGTRIGS